MQVLQGSTLVERTGSPAATAAHRSQWQRM